MYWQTFVFSYSFPFIFNNLNSSTTKTGDSINKTNSNICSLGNNTMLNMFLNFDVNSIINIKAAEPISANSNVLLLNGFELNNDF